MERRNFIRQAGLAAAGLFAFRLEALAQPREAYSGVLLPVHNIPENKGLDAAWVRSLYERGKPTVYTKAKNELRYIGMPAGGLHTGTVYLGGDGRLWLWSIYNDEREGIDPKTVLWNDGVAERQIRNRDGASYVEPAVAANRRVLDQGFAVIAEFGGKTFISELREEDWEEVSFEAAYPIATVRYKHRRFPLEVSLRAGGIFIPLDADNSGLPATIFDISIKNTSAQPVRAAIAGWLENGARKITAKKGEGEKYNTAHKGNGYTRVLSGFKSSGAADRPDDGTTCITYIGEGGIANAGANPWPVNAAFFTAQSGKAEAAADEKLVASIAAPSKTLAPGGTLQAQFVLTWHFNHPLKKTSRLKDAAKGYRYASLYEDAGAVADYLAPKFKDLWGQTLRWHKTYYDSTLPHWLLERALLNIGTIATANTYRFADGRFWGWEGVNACEGTCTHVWQYAQAMGRIFPSLESDTRQRTDLGNAMQEDGGIIFRAEYEGRPAIDGQAGTILRIYREHQMSKDDRFLRQNWAQIKKAVNFMLAQDKNGDGMTDTPMENTLDAVWEGEIAWIVGLCIAAARAAQFMAEEVNDTAFADRCRDYVEKGNANMSKHLFNGEYFIHRPDAVQGRQKLGSYNTCHIDQVYGQSWAFQVGLGRLWDKQQTLSALKSLWKYNFTMDVGPYIKTHIGGRPYALEGEGGMIMNTNPHNEAKPFGENVTWQLGYFHECMSGFEHQVASHMMAEGMTDEALVLTRAIHDRYHAAKRNPFNEIECSDHYARAMASYGTFITACGFEYHGPKGYLRFAPAWKSREFRAPFTAAEGWGTYSQQAAGNGTRCSIAMAYGALQLRTLKLVAGGNTVTATAGGKKVPATLERSGQEVTLHFTQPLQLKEGETLQIQLV
ncbi:GH116 family glycosyl hydrolase [Chitinophaga deserti]|uniref:GH116 family glycosyl hydrolase n=1 Tax=Chitinophaga deserti TaxID=2164099 RepID=UPI000D6B53C7|nr:GH116 family glycosyl hydrolase [Chitinophaga deserti]